MSFACEHSCSSPRRVSNFNSKVPQGGIYPHINFERDSLNIFRVRALTSSGSMGGLGRGGGDAKTIISPNTSYGGYNNNSCLINAKLLHVCDLGFQIYIRDHSPIILQTQVPGISVTAPIRQSTPWALIRKKFLFKRPWALPKIKIYVFCSVCRNFMQYIGMLSKHILMIS